LKQTHSGTKLIEDFFFLICSIKLFFQCLKSKNSIIFSFQGNFYAILVAIILKKKIIVRSNLSPYGWKSAYFKIIIFKFLLSKADIVVVNSYDFKRQVKKMFNINSEVIYNPLNLLQINKNSSYKKKITFYKKKTINLITVGRLVDQKNQIEIIKAIKKLGELAANYRLLIIGNGPKKEELERFIISNSLQRYIKLLFSKKRPNI
jgi:glycosyltransferase involved in cell wall biosynthesis